MTDTKRKINIRIIAAAAGICVFAGLLILGTFNDRSISDALRSEDNFFAKALGVIGPMPLFFVLAPMCGALVQRALACGYGKGAKTLLTALAAAALLGVCYFAAKCFTSSDCLDSVLPGVRNNWAVTAPILVCVFLPLGYLGARLARKNEDALLARRIILLIAVALTAYITLETIKNTMHRPRPRTVLKGFEGLGFVPWYEKFPFTKELPDQLGIYKTEFASFPSGHSMMSMTSFITFPALTWLIPSLKGKELPLAFCGMAYSAVVMFCRIVAGAHYLSDIAFSGTAMLTFSVIYLVILKKTLKE